MKQNRFFRFKAHASKTPSQCSRISFGNFKNLPYYCDTFTTPKRRVQWTQNKKIQCLDAWGGGGKVGEDLLSPTLLHEMHKRLWQLSMRAQFILVKKMWKLWGKVKGAQTGWDDGSNKLALTFNLQWGFILHLL